jgi:hypothetical protein
VPEPVSDWWSRISMGLRTSSAARSFLAVSTLLLALGATGLAGCSGDTAPPASPEAQEARKKALAEENAPTKNKTGIKSPTDLKSIKGRLIEK